MPELIDRLETIQRIKNVFCLECDCERDDASCRMCEYNFCIGVLKEMPTIEPEVRHGRWKTKVIHDAYCFQCSACNSIYNGDTHYCPHCGAKMDAGHIADDSKNVGGADNG